MNRSYYYNYIEERLSNLATKIERRGKLNLLELHQHSENFYRDLFNELYPWELHNLNVIKPNAEAIDLIDHKNKIVIQVSATATKEKIESALTKDLSAFAGYTFKFILISKDAKALRSKNFLNPHELSFNPDSDIYDMTSILKVICGLGIDDQRRIYDFIKKELGTEADPQKLESNLAAIINILAKGDLSLDASTYETIPYAIDKKIEYNNLDAARSIVDDYYIHHGRVDKIYSEFDKLGVNKSTSVLDSIRRDYFAHKARFSDDDLFFKVIECVVDRIQKSANYKPLAYEELELCVNILIVDAFIRCKIFKNPERNTDAAS